MTLPARGGWELLSRLRSEKAPEEACAAILVGPQSVVANEPCADPVIAALPTPLDYDRMCEIIREHCAPRQQDEAASA